MESNDFVPLNEKKKMNLNNKRQVTANNGFAQFSILQLNQEKSVNVSVVQRIE